MKRGINKALVLGQIVECEGLRYWPNSTGCTLAFTLRTVEVSKKRDGSKGETPEDHRVEFYNQRAEQLQTQLKSGVVVYVEGRLKTLKGNQGIKSGRSKTVIQGDKLEFITVDF